ncbi:biotin--[acetyl-CoA-carboxylase] ligase [Sphingobium subterraneum]|uniref:biotin--[acetyl-CoA-carboxylase] ligase n=1 Tax=Sphingobium subterraneum TaxID=627688 RepID=UPI001613869D|nr:biotin--[acetyl-CoA-carboxylase] ligase [Sphingobium subterraneum]
MDIRVIRETGSTNADMLALAGEGVPEGVWLRAERQTSGKGRMGRQWEGDEGNLYASTLVRLRDGDPPAPSLALVAGVAVHAALTHFAPDSGLTIKWPNDILADQAKIAGILLERAGDAVVIGIGVNVTHHPLLTDRATTSLRALGVSMCDATSLCEELAGQCVQMLALWRSHGLDAIRSQWLSRAHPPGSPLLARLPDGTQVEGQFETLDRDGALILRLANGARSVIHAADIFLL